MRREMKVSSMPIPKGRPARMGTIQWMSALAVQPYAVIDVSV